MNLRALGALVVCFSSAAAAAELTDRERAQRAADGPRRMVLEASRIAPKPARPADADRPAARVQTAAAVPAGAAPRPAPRTVSPPLVAETPSPSAAEAEPQPQAVAAAAAAEPAPPAVAPEPVVEPMVTAAAVAPAQPQPVAAEPPPAAPELPPPQLLSMVEPNMPRHLSGRLHGDIKAVVRMTVRADGSVADVVIESSSHRQMDGAFADAVLQWRFAPAAAARTHALHVVFKPL